MICSHRIRRSSLRAAALAAALGGTTLVSVDAAHAAPTAKSADDYRYFRALTIDLVGRVPTRAELVTFESAGFDLDKWIDAHLAGPAYAERIRRIYMDLMRLEESSTFQFVPAQTYLHRIQILGPDGAAQWLYYRNNQRRTRVETDGSLCLSAADSGIVFNGIQTPQGTPIPVTQAILDANTVLVKPWWLYSDYASAAPSNLYGSTWTSAPATYQPSKALLNEPDGKTPSTMIRVCKEEAQSAAMGTIYTSGRTKAVPAGTPPPYGRLTQLPVDSAYAQKNSGAAIACTGSVSYQTSADCGCGVGLERCTPGGALGLDPVAFTLPTDVNLGTASPLDLADAPESAWNRFWWSQEARQFIEDIVANDRDFRQMVTSPATMVNGPLAQFYANTAAASMTTVATGFNYVMAQGLFQQANVPTDLKPYDTEKWERVDNRGPNASGLLTMPIFLTKFGSRRGRAHVLYQAFMCHDFQAGNVALTPSTEPNLMIRPGCSTCHATLEPLAAYFSRVVESDWTYLPSSNFPIDNTVCKASDPTKMSYACQVFYDPAFTSSTSATLRGAYASSDHAEGGPLAMGNYLAGTPDFPTCVANNVASSFLGRPLTSDDAAMETALATALTSSGWSMKALVHALVVADAYKSSNNLSSSAWRAAQAAGGGK
ncbi:MAG: DUF1549 domain-containing protein [Polyangiales bacterium]